MTKKQQKRLQIIQYIQKYRRVTQNDIANRLGMSIPLANSYVNELVAMGAVQSDGVMDSTGGRKAHAFSVNPDYVYAIGVEVKPDKLNALLFNFAFESVAWESYTIDSSTPELLYPQIGSKIDDFIHKNQVPEDRLAGVGIAVPGAVDADETRISNDYALGIKNVHKNVFCQAIPYNCILANVADAAGYNEVSSREDNDNIIYLHLSEQVGAAILINGVLYKGQNQNGGKINHMILVPEGKDCFCGRKGCANMYCSTKALAGDYGIGADDIGEFFSNLRGGDEQCIDIWNNYLENLAVIVNNLTLIFDCDIVIGGKIGEYFSDYYDMFIKTLKDIGGVSFDSAHVKTSVSRNHTIESGIARRVICDYISAKV